MAEVAYIWQSTATSQAAVENDGVMTAIVSKATRVYRLVSDVNITDIGAWSSPTVPRMSDALPGHVGLYVVEKTARQEEQDDYKHWLVDVVYERASKRNPIYLPPVIEFQSAVYTRVADTYYKYTEDEYEEKPILNSAGDKFDPPLEREVTLTRLVIQKNYAWSAFSAQDKYDFENSVNMYPMSIASISASALCAKMLSIDIQVGNLTDVKKTPYWIVKFTIEINRDKYTRKVLDAGYNYIDTSVSPEQKKQILLNGQAAADPQLLDGSGGKGDPDDPEYLEFDTILRKDWKQFDLPEVIYNTATGALGSDASDTDSII
jgi:hypothetical protein